MLFLFEPSLMGERIIEIALITAVAAWATVNDHKIKRPFAVRQWWL
jgi:hypothetical protein